MSRRAKQEKLDYLRQYHGVTDPEPEAKEAAGDEAPHDEQERTQTCHFCSGQMHATGSTHRPRVYEVMEMPLSRFRRAQAGVRVTLGPQLPEIQAKRSGDEPLPAAMRRRAEEIRQQYDALLTSGFS